MAEAFENFFFKVSPRLRPGLTTLIDAAKATLAAGARLSRVRQARRPGPRCSWVQLKKKVKKPSPEFDKLAEESCSRWESA